MMSSKRVSQLALLSIFLTFSHAVGYANSCGSVELHTTCVSPEGFKKVKSCESRKSKLKQRNAEAAERVAYSRRGVSSSLSLKNFLRSKSSAAKDEERRCAEKKSEARCRSVGSVLKGFVRDLCSDKSSSPVSARKKFATRQKSSSINFSQTLVKTATEGPQRFRVVVQNVKESSQPAVAVRGVEGCRISEDKEMLSKTSDSSLRELAQGATLPVFIRPDVAAMEKTEKARLLQELTQELKSSKRKSSRVALESREGTKVARDGSVTSTLRYDVKKAVAVKEKRNSSVRPRIRAEKSSYSKREKKADVLTIADGQESSTDPAKEKGAVAATNFYKNALADGNTNVGSYLDAKQHRCDSSDTDWPCASCVSKRRAHTSISVCTMVVTIVAMIVGALIISNATDDPTPATTTPVTTTTTTTVAATP